MPRLYILIKRKTSPRESASEAGRLSIQCNDIEREMSGVEHVQKNQSLKQKDKELIWHAMKGAEPDDSIIVQKGRRLGYGH